MTGIAAPNTHNAKLVAGLLSKAPTLADIIAAARELVFLLRHKHQEAFTAIVEAASCSLLQPFVSILCKDRGRSRGAGTAMERKHRGRLDQPPQYDRSQRVWTRRSSSSASLRGLCRVAL